MTPFGLVGAVVGAITTLFGIVHSDAALCMLGMTGMGLPLMLWESASDTRPSWEQEIDHDRALVADHRKDFMAGLIDVNALEDRIGRVLAGETVMDEFERNAARRAEANAEKVRRDQEVYDRAGIEYETVFVDSMPHPVGVFPTGDHMLAAEHERALAANEHRLRQIEEKLEHTRGIDRGALRERLRQDRIARVESEAAMLEMQH